MQGGVSERLEKAGHLPQRQGQPGARMLGLLQCLICQLALPKLAECGLQARRSEPWMEQKGHQHSDPQLSVLELVQDWVDIGISYQKWTGSCFHISVPQA